MSQWSDDLVEREVWCRSAEGQTILAEARTWEERAVRETRAEQDPAYQFQQADQHCTALMQAETTLRRRLAELEQQRVQAQKILAEALRDLKSPV